MKMKGSRRSAGLSLIEVVIGMAILSAVMLMTYTILFSVTNTSKLAGEVTNRIAAVSTNM